MADAFIVVGAALTALCVATIYSDLLTHRLHILFRQRTIEHCRICNPPREDDPEP